MDAYDLIEVIHGLEVVGYEDRELRMMFEAVKEVKPDFIGDWGTNRGSSARIMFESCRLLAYPTKIVTVELPIELSMSDDSHPRGDVGFFLSGTNVLSFVGDGVTTALRSYAATVSAENPLFFIDGDHLYENVLRELFLIERVCPVHSLLLHDTNYDPGAAIRTYLSREREDLYEVYYVDSAPGMTLLLQK